MTESPSGMQHFRYPAPRPSILKEIPEPLKSLFSDQDQDKGPDTFSEEIDYVYETLASGGGSTCPLYCGYTLDTEGPYLPAPFKKGDRLDLGGVPVEVVRSSYMTSRYSLRLGLKDFDFVYHRVSVRPVDESRA